ncbi:MAG: 6-pyruvoyl-tetrahydropterin synthase-related protein [Blastocatellia bacterium]|nr:6-pyruvoyl-tetrahydropterin synthase-related protein [Blastocatellia bacterium]
MIPTIAPKENVFWRPLILCLVFASIAALPFFVIGEDQRVGCCGGEMPVTHDSWMHFNQMRAFARGLAAGRIYPRWDEETHGFGAPTASFYPPATYYLTSAFYFLTGKNWLGAWIGFYWLAAAGAACAMYAYAARRMSRGAALLAAAVYVFGPYRLINQYQRGAMAELLAFALLPPALLFAERLIEGDAGRRRHFLGLAAAYGAFLWAHPPTAYQFTLVFGVCLSIRGLALREGRGIALALGAMGFGAMLAAAYFLPAIAEQHLVHYDDVERTWPYHASYVYDFAQKVYDHAGNPFFVRLDRIWAFNLGALLLGAAILATGRPAKPRDRRDWWCWMAAGLLAAFLMTPWSAPVGRWIPKIEIGVFSWRMLALIGFAMALLAGACIERAPRPWLGGLAGGLLLIATLAMSGWYVVWPMWRGQAFAPNPEHYNFATLPRGAPRDVPNMAPVQTASGNGRITVERWAPEWRELRVELDRDDRLEFRTFHFPGWTALVDGRPAEIHVGPVRNIVLDLPAGTHRVTLDFRATPIRRAGNAITILAFAGLLALLRIDRRPH